MFYNEAISAGAAGKIPFAEETDLSKTELNMPLILDGERWAYGGDQEWCPTAWHRLCGCGPTCGANLAAYYALNRPSMRGLYRGSVEPFSKQEYTDAIEDVFRFITPSYLGFPYAGRFASRFRAYALDHGVKLTAHGCGNAGTPQQMFDFTRRTIDAGDPAALLILRHRAPELADDNWHWVTISGYCEGEGEPQVILSNCGEREVRPASLLFERNPKNTVRILCFRELR